MPLLLSALVLVLLAGGMDNEEDGCETLTFSSVKFLSTVFLLPPLVDIQCCCSLCCSFSWSWCPACCRRTSSCTLSSRSRDSRPIASCTPARLFCRRVMSRCIRTSFCKRAETEALALASAEEEDEEEETAEGCAVLVLMPVLVRKGRSLSTDPATASTQPSGIFSHSLPSSP